MRRCVALLPLLALGGCTGFQSPLVPQADQADWLFQLFALMMAVCRLMYVLLMGLLLWGLWRGRGRYSYSEAPAVEPADTGLSRSLLSWAGLIVAGLTLLATGSFLAERALAGARARETLTVSVTGHQWWWRIQYREQASGAVVETANELHLPLGRTTRVELGAVDVTHSFWVPNLSGKLDMIPGRSNVVNLTPRKVGWYRGQCAEFCGAQHAHMGFPVKVDTPAEFAAWLAAQARAAAAPATRRPRAAWRW